MAARTILPSFVILLKSTNPKSPLSIIPLPLPPTSTYSGGDDVAVTFVTIWIAAPVFLSHPSARLILLSQCSTQALYLCGGFIAEPIPLHVIHIGIAAHHGRQVVDSCHLLCPYDDRSIFQMIGDAVS